MVYMCKKYELGTYFWIICEVVPSFLSLMQSPVCGADTCAVERVGVVEVVAGSSSHLKCEACARECEFVVNLPCCVPAQPCCCERERPCDRR